MEYEDAMAEAPVLRNVLRAMVAARLKPESMRALPSRRMRSLSESVALIVPSKKMAALCYSAQSPPDGTPCGSMNVSAVPVKVMPESVMPLTGRA